MEALVLIILCGFAAAFITYAAFQELQRERLALGGRGKRGGIVQAAQLVVDWLAHRVQRVPMGRARDRLAAWCVLAGYEDRLDPERLIARGIIASILCTIFYIWWGGAVSLGSVGAGLTMGLALVAAKLMLKVRARKAEIERALPTTMDMLTLSVEAGLDFGQAISRIASATKANALTRELERLIAELKLGVSRADALARLARRIRVPALKALASTLIQADRFGAPIGPTLRAHAERVRGERMMRAEKAGAMAAQKALIPLIVCIMPVTFIVVFGPLVARYLTGGFDHLFR